MLGLPSLEGESMVDQLGCQVGLASPGSLGVKISAHRCHPHHVPGVPVRPRLELRVTDVTFDQTAQIFIRDCARRTIRFIANEPDSRDRAEYRDNLRQVIRDNDLTDPTT
jgi:hypothetical protein